MALLFQPPVREVLREPTRGAFRRKILDAGAIDDGDSELGLDRVQGAADNIGMHLGGNVERLEAPLISSRVASTRMAFERNRESRPHTVRKRFR